MKSSTRLPFGLSAALLLSLSAFADAKEDTKLAEDVKTSMEALKKSDTTLASKLMTASGYVIFPSVGKGGLGVGAAHGRGEVYEKDKLIGHASLTQVTIGLQIGGQEFSELILFEDKAALDRFKDSKMEMSAQIGAVAAAEGAAKNAKFVDGVLVYTRPKSGLMAEASVGGQKFKFKALGAPEK